MVNPEGLKLEMGSRLDLIHWFTVNQKFPASLIQHSRSPRHEINVYVLSIRLMSLEVSELWRQVVINVASEYPDVELSHMYVDNAAMQLIRAPKQFDVIVTGNMFGDILSDCAAMLTGSIGMLPSASLNESAQGMYEPVHGSAPDIAGQGKANPLATILSLSMMMRYSLSQPDLADALDEAVRRVLDDGLRTADITSAENYCSTSQMGDAVIAQLRN